MIIRPFRELPEHDYFRRYGEPNIGRIQEHPVALYELDTPDVSESRYWQVIEPDAAQKLRALFEAAPHGYLAGLSLSHQMPFPQPSRQRLEGYFSDSDSSLILEYTHLLSNLHSLAIAGELAPDTEALLHALPDLRYYKLSDADGADFSLVRHANLKWLSVGVTTGLASASFPRLEGLELSYVALDMMYEFFHTDLSRLTHFGIDGLCEGTVEDYFSHPAFPTHIRSLYVNGATLEEVPVVLFEHLLSFPAREQLKRLSISNVYSPEQTVITDANFPSLEHLAMHDWRAQNADYWVSVLFDAALPKGITSLDLHGVEFSDDAAQMILQQPFIQRLNYLNLTGNKMEDAALQAEFKALRANGCTVAGVE